MNIISMFKKFHGQWEDGLKCHTNSRRKDNLNHQLIHLTMRSLYQRRIVHRWHQWVLVRLLSEILRKTLSNE